MTWSWLWSEAHAPAAVDGLPDWYVVVLQRMFRRQPPTIPADRRLIAGRIAADHKSSHPQLTQQVSKPTQRALAVLDPYVLYELLKLDAVSGSGEKVKKRSAFYKNAAATHESERERWTRIAADMRSLAQRIHVDGMHCANVQVLPSGVSMYPDAISFGFTGEGEICEVHACWLLEQWANEADKRAMSASGAATRALANAERDSKDDKPFHLARLGALVEVLRASVADGDPPWEHGDIADLIVASRRDWKHPPTPLAEAYSYDCQSEARAVEPNRLALAKWISKQLAPKKIAPRSRATRTRRRR